MDCSVQVHEAFEVLKNGGIILYPTDTVWGIGCDASNENAVRKIYELKQRALEKSMLVLVNGERMMHQIFPEIPEVAWQILDFAEKPTTLVLDKPKNVAQNIIAPDNSLGVRMVKEAFCYKLLERLKKPIVATSANIAGAPTPFCFAEIDAKIIEGVDYVVDWKKENVCKTPSSIIKLTLDSRVSIIRK